MNGDTIKEFLVSLGFNVEGDQGFTGAINKATLLVTGLGVAAVAAGAGIFAFTKGVAEEFDQLGDIANRVGETVDRIAELGHIAELSGSDINTATASLEMFNRVVGDASAGKGKGVEVFERLGLSLKDANGELKNTTDLMFEVGETIKDMSRSEQISVLQRLGIDKSMIDTLTGDVSELRDEFRQVYASVGLDANAAAEASGNFMDSLYRLQFALGAIGKSIAVTFMSRFTESMDRLRKMVVDNLPRIMSVLEPTIRVILTLADVFIAMAYRATQAIVGLLGWVADIVSAMDGWMIAITALAAAWKYLNLSFLATPIGAILALGAALLLLVDDFMTWKEGGDSLIDWESWQSEIQLVTDILGTLKTILENMFTYLFATVDAIIKLFSGDFSGAFRAMEVAIESLANILRSIFGGTVDEIMGKVSSMIDLIKGGAGAVAGFFGFGGAAGPAIGAPGVGSQTSQSVNQKTEITIMGGDAQSTAQEVARQQTRVNGDMVRNLKGPAR